ncbi:hypothetical protein R2A130_2588 [Ahrensia sp. R2A130]|nr:hypothetical protein R2A130_2588 [Ahrensia sp. R2A130]
MCWTSLGSGLPSGFIAAARITKALDRTIVVRTTHLSKLRKQTL